MPTYPKRNGNRVLPLAQASLTGSGPVPTIIALTTAGVGTFPVPAGVNRVKITVTGAGATVVTNATNTGSGGSGATAIGSFSVTPGETLSYQVGQTNNAANNSYVIGSFGTINAPGANNNTATTTGGTGATGATGGQILVDGADGVNYQAAAAQGAASFWGGGARFQTNTARAYGSGAGGAAANAGTFLGANGIVVIEY